MCDSEACPLDLLTPPDDCHFNYTLSFSLQVRDFIWWCFATSSHLSWFSCKAFSLLFSRYFTEYVLNILVDKTFLPTYKTIILYSYPLDFAFQFNSNIIFYCFHAIEELVLTHACTSMNSTRTLPKLTTQK